MSFGLLAIPACGNDEIRVSLEVGLEDSENEVDESLDLEQTGGSPSRITIGALNAVKPYEACESQEDCGDELKCLELLGSRVCGIVGCKEDDTCIDGEVCVVSEVIAPEGVCAFTGAEKYCARHCRDPLICNLQIECMSRACCGTVEDGCPSRCMGMDPMECEIAPQCAVECCARP